jgi:hypothetical protein
MIAIFLLVNMVADALGTRAVVPFSAADKKEATPMVSETVAPGTDRGIGGVSR